VTERSDGSPHFPYRSLYVRIRSARVRFPGDRRFGSGSPIVVMMQPSKSRSGKDATRGYSANSADRCSLLESEMRVVVMVVADIISEQTPQVARWGLPRRLRHSRRFPADSKLNSGVRPWAVDKAAAEALSILSEKLTVLRKNSVDALSHSS
jgi:hypothetical protein